MKNTKKLLLDRTVVRNLSLDQLARAAGGDWVPTLFNTLDLECWNTSVNGGGGGGSGGGVPNTRAPSCKYIPKTRVG